MLKFPEWQRENWVDASNNPLVGYFEEEKEKFAIGDPQVLVPGEYDEKWHMFYHGFYEDFKPYFHHLCSDNGLEWELLDKWQWNVGPCYLFCDGTRWILYYTNVVSESSELRKNFGADMIISARWTFDFQHWSDPVDLLTPQLPWETDGKKVELRNPCMVKLAENWYRLYYCGGNVWLDQCDYEEPKYVSFADAPTPFGPFVKYGAPILGPDDSCPYRNLGSGGFKVFSCEKELIALYNPIYLDPEGKVRSAIAVMASKDGVQWEDAPYNPIILPDQDWKRAIVYQLDLVKYQGELRLYYNARDDWRDGIERIGMSTLKGGNVASIKKLWKLPQKFCVD